MSDREQGVASSRSGTESLRRRKNVCKFRSCIIRCKKHQICLYRYWFIIILLQTSVSHSLFNAVFVRLILILLLLLFITHADSSGVGLATSGVYVRPFVRLCVSLFFHTISQKAMRLGSPNYSELFGLFGRTGRHKFRGSIF